MHWVIYPSAESAKASFCAARWKARGYHVLVFTDRGVSVPSHADIVISGRFPGYYRIINKLAFHAVHAGGATLVTAIGDDMEPDPHLSADDVEAVYFRRFPDGYGVLQGTGDRQGVDEEGRPASERICGSPTFGLGWIERGYGGRGPFCEEYHSFYGDEDLYNVAVKKGVLEQNQDIMIYHRHWSWGHQPRAEYQRTNAMSHWDDDKYTFLCRQRSGFAE